MTEDEKQRAFLRLTESVADECIKALKLTGYAEHWLFFRPGTIEVAIVPRGVQSAPPGFTLASADPVPVTYPRDAMIAWARLQLQLLPLFPAAAVERPASFR